MTQVLTTALTLATTSSVLFAAEIDAAAILRCQAMQDDASRLACYDELNSPKPSAAEPVATDPAPTAPPPAESAVKDPRPVETAPVEQGSEKAADSRPEPSVAAEERAVIEPKSLDDEIGQETLRGGDKKTKLAVHGRVVRCQQDIRKKYLFYFDNGQIWKQKDNKRITWDECEFDVTISKDFFGYKMTPEGENRHIRVARTK
ncbi:MAG: hypothetical protein ACR2QZ_01310 [Woeseiaceae bacterium]